MDEIIKQAVDYIEENVVFDCNREQLLDWIDYMIDGDDTPDMTDLDAVVNWIESEYYGIEVA